MIDYKEEYTDLARTQAALRRNTPEMIGKFQEVAKEALKEKHLPTKTKELIAVGIAVSVRCESCILGHVRDAIKAGATIEELSETIEVAILMGGGPSTAYGAKALSIAEHLLG
ncbi:MULTISPECIES: carboxymuconolactone decarboxylase family protein [Enterococcus]|uniref:Carboxymuconolactone decarboxylase family protein n=1 Tax=Candidatus Enterococcus murrayae TaxID=2815321 RepID=A0ABS3HMX7_9ENTE|nr:carboxymuconolactone decarboxylase family protein [Enterococcus sp. MJM16]MBO0454230.1 carboxymuconolactone decarboxylase family protein [Enterococcus sp. MJM16]